MKSNRPTEEYLAGRNAAKEMLESDASRVVKVMLSKTAAAPFAREVRELAKQADVPVQVVPPQRLNMQLPNVNHQGILVQISPVEYIDVHDLLSTIAPTLDDVRTIKPIVLVLDHIQDPYNFGAILRSAVAAGAAGVIIPDRDAVPVNSTVMKTSAGAATKIPVARTSHLGNVIEEMKERGYWIAGASGEGDTSVWDMDWDRAIGLVIGSEEKGMKPSIEKQCDFKVSIPIKSEMESLNASVAAGILLIASTRSRI